MLKLKVKSVKSLGVQKTYSLTMKSEQHNYFLYDPKNLKSVVSRNSHAYAYAYISARELWLKAHYPIEYFAALLTCKKETEKIKEYKIDASRYGRDIQICGIDINKSKDDFHIDGNKIYFSFSKIKGMGEKIAEKVVQHQPYTNFADFLIRFGTEKKVVYPLIALGAFDSISENYTKEFLFRFYNFYKDTFKHRKNRHIQYEKAMEKYQQQVEEIFHEYLPNPKSFDSLCRFDEEVYEKWRQLFEDMKIDEPYNYKGEKRFRSVSIYKKLMDIVNRRESSIRTFQERELYDEETSFKLEEFEAFNQYNEKYSLDKEALDLIAEPRLAETTFYGFQWTHDLEESPHYTGLTMDSLEMSGQPVGPVEVLVTQSAQLKKSKAGNEYWSMQIEDATGKRAFVTIWNEDYERFADEFRVNKLLRLQLKPPSGGFSTFNFDSPRKHERRRFIPANKEDDHRVFVMDRKPAPVVVVPKKTEVDEFEILI